MDCPVCLRRDLPAEALACPQCDANLRGLRLLAVAQVTKEAPIAVSPSGFKWPMALAAVVLLAGGLLLGRGLTATPPVITPPLGSVNTAPVKANDIKAINLAAARDSIRALQGGAASALTGRQTGTFTYVVRRGDTLRGIAWRLYGRAALAEKLQVENGIADPRRLQIGTKLRLFSI